MINTTNYIITVNCPFCFAKINYEARNCMYCTNSLISSKEEIDYQVENIILIINQIRDDVELLLNDYHEQKRVYTENDNIWKEFYSLVVLMYAVPMISIPIIFTMLYSSYGAVVRVFGFIIGLIVGVGIGNFISNLLLLPKGYNYRIRQPKFPFNNISENLNAEEITREMVVSNLGIIDEQSGKIVIDSETCSIKYNDMMNAY